MTTLQSTDSQTPYYSQPPCDHLFVAIALYSKDRTKITPSRLSKLFKDASEEEKNTKDWIGIISENQEYGTKRSKNLSPVEYLQAYHIEFVSLATSTEYISSDREDAISG